MHRVVTFDYKWQTCRKGFFGNINLENHGEKNKTLIRLTNFGFAVCTDILTGKIDED